jgi:hypothetical protein
VISESDCVRRTTTNFLNKLAIPSYPVNKYILLTVVLDSIVAVVRHNIEMVMSHVTVTVVSLISANSC